MRFLCLHGQGTSSKIFESQTAALRHELGDELEFDFIEGSVPAEPAPEIAGLGRRDDHYYSWIDPHGPDCAEIAREVLEELDEYIASEGPFDGVMAFSQGAAVAGSYMVHKMRQNPREQLVYPVFRCGIFLSGLPPADLEALFDDSSASSSDDDDSSGGGGSSSRSSSQGGGAGQWRPMSAETSGTVIRIPTVHVWGTNDATHAASCATFSAMCDETNREVVIHHGGHEIPGVRDPGALKDAASSIRKTIRRAMLRQ